MLITSKFKSRCNACDGDVAVGALVSWTPGAKGVSHAECSVEGKQVAATVVASHATDSDIDIPCNPGLSYLPFQRAGIAAALAHFENSAKGALIADEMGLGKTIQAIGVINASASIRSVLVVCPASLKTNWRRECDKWLMKPDKHVAHSDVSVTITNYERLADVSDVYDLVVIDEAHYVKNPKTQRTNHVKRICSMAKHVLMLTGTPICNRPIELFPMLSILRPDVWDQAGKTKRDGKYVQVGPGEGAGYFKYALRYCDAHAEHHSRSRPCTGKGCKDCHWEFGGSSNLEDLQNKLRSTVMIRRTKDQVLKDLPPKRRQIVYLSGGPNDDYADVDLSDDYNDAVRTVRSKIPFEDISRVRHEQGVAKAPLVAEHVRNALDSGSDKIVVFAHHKDVIATIVQKLLPYSVVGITGDSTQEERQTAVDAFQNDPGVRVFVGSILAAGVGLTLTAASHVIIAELDWTPGNVQQAEDRCHRIGQTESVLVQHLVWEGSLDSRLTELLDKKSAVINQAVNAPAPIAPVVSNGANTSIDLSEYDHASWCAFVLEESLGCDCLPGKKHGPPVPPPREITDKEVEVIHNALRQLAGVCDGAVTRDGCGFNKLDSSFGSKLASLPRLTDKQALAARRMLKKYVRQVGEV